MKLQLSNIDGVLIDYRLQGTPIVATPIGDDPVWGVFSAAHVVAVPFTSQPLSSPGAWAGSGDLAGFHPIGMQPL